MPLLIAKLLTVVSCNCTPILISTLLFEGNSDDLDELEETIDLNKEFGTSTVVEVGRHPFAQMQSNPDDVKISSMSSYTTAEQRQLENKRRSVSSADSLK